MNKKNIKLVRGQSYMTIGTPRFALGVVYAVLSDMADSLLAKEAEQGQRFFVETTAEADVDYTTFALTKTTEEVKPGEFKIYHNPDYAPQVDDSIEDLNPDDELEDDGIDDDSEDTGDSGDATSGSLDDTGVKPTKAPKKRQFGKGVQV